VALAVAPISLYIYSQKHYCIDRTVTPDFSAIKQRWDAFWQSIAIFVHNNTDVMILTFFADIKEVSVYSVYNYVIFSLKNFLTNIMLGPIAAFGNMLAKGETELAHKNLCFYELIIFDVCAILYTTAGLLIVPFAMLYTKNVTDVNYSRPLFALIAITAGCFDCLRIPYQSIVEAAGHFRQNRNGALIEPILNITISIIGVIRFGLVGVAFGTLVATLFRTIQYVIYLSKNIIQRSVFIFIRHLAVNIGVAIVVWCLTSRYVPRQPENVFQWCFSAATVTLISTVVTLLSTVLFYESDFKEFIHKLKAIFFEKDWKLRR